MIVGDSVIAYVELTVPNDDCPGCLITKQAVGGKKITMKRGTTEWLDIASDMKACVTDALKKAATLLGVALDLYGTEEHEDVEEAKQPEKKEEDGPATEAQKNAIKTIAASKKRDLEEVLKSVGVASLSDLKLSQAKVIITTLNASK
jgi:predicted CopG family antitoxin